MTSKVSLVKLERESIKRSLPMGVLLALGYFCVFPLMGLLVINSYERAGASYGLGVEKMVQELMKNLTVFNGPLLMVTVIAAGILGILQFTYLHSREKQDFYHSLPVSRVQLFFVQYGAGVLLWAVPYVGNLLILTLIAGMKGGMTGAILSLMVKSILIHLISFLLIYSFMILAMVLTGKIFVAIFGMAVFCGYLPALALLGYCLCSTYWNTFYDSLEYASLVYWSPFYGCAKMMTDFISPEASARDITLAMLLLTMVVVLVAVCFYRKRGSEMAGHAMAFSGIARGVKFLLVVPVTVFGEILFYEITRDGGAAGSVLWGIFGMLFAFLLSTALIEFIYRMDIREVFRDKGQMALSLAVSVAVIFFFALDLPGYDRWMPKREEVESMTLRDPELSGRAHVRKLLRLYLNDRGGMEYEVDKWLDGEPYETKEMEDLYTFVENCQRTQTNEEGDINRTIVITWNMKNGTSASRRYFCDDGDLEAYFGPVEQNEDYQEAKWPILRMEKKQILDITLDCEAEVPYYEYAGELTPLDLEEGIPEEMELSEAESGWYENFYGQKKYKLTREQRERLLPVLKEELKNLTWQQEEMGDYKGTLSVIYMEEDGNVYEEDLTLMDEMPKTLEMLKGFGMEMTD